ncbi:MAG: hypothetical protein U0230_03440 [Polyangiales bacterium]
MLATALRRSASLAFVLLSLVSGCSLVYSTDDARRPGPSAPTLHVDPAEPDTSDTLRVVLDAASVDGFGRTVTYEYAWTKQGSSAVVGASDSIEPALTTRGDVFTVRVTPVADGRFRGPAAEVTVTVANARPTVAYVGLSRYDVFRDDTIEVFAGPTSDADGDLVTRRIEWRIDGMPIGVSSSELALATLMLAAGSRVEVVVTPNDGIDDGAAVVAGPARVRGPGTQWRPWVPEHGPHGSMGDMLGWHAVFDEPRNRLLFFASATVGSGATQTNRFHPWEYAIDTQRWARLVPPNVSGGDFSTYARPFVDAAGKRVVFYGELDPDPALVTPLFAKQVRVFHLDQRGNESWETVPLAAGSPVPPWRFGESVVLDAANHRLLMYGGMTYGGEFFDDLWALHLDEGNVRWEPLATSTAFGPLVGATFLLDAQGGAAYLAGGAFDAAGNWPPATPRKDVYRFDLGSNTFGGGPAAQLPASVSMASAIPLPDGSGALLVGGLSSFVGEPRNDAVYRFDFATRTFSDATPPVGPRVGHLGVWPSLAIDPTTGRVLVATTGGDTDRGVSFYSLALDGHDLSAIDVYGVTTPPALSQLGSAYGNGTFAVFFGLRDPTSFGTDLAENGVWSFGATGRFERVEPAGRPAEGRYGFEVAPSSSVPSGVLLAGGYRLVGGSPVPALEAYSYVPGSPAGFSTVGTLSPSASYAHGALAPCSASTFALLGGDGTAGGVSTVSNVQCGAGTCAVAASSGTLPTGGLVGASFATLSEGWGYLVGGDGPSAGVWSFAESYVCASSGSSAVNVPVPSFPSVVGGTTHVLPPALSATTYDMIVIGPWDDGGTLFERVGKLSVPQSNPASGGTFSELTPAGADRPEPRHYAASSATGTGTSFFVYGGLEGSVSSGTGRPHSDLWQLRYEAP